MPYLWTDESNRGKKSLCINPILFTIAKFKETSLHKFILQSKSKSNKWNSDQETTKTLSSDNFLLIKAIRKKERKKKERGDGRAV